MATRLSRRQVLGIGAASLAAGIVWPKRGDAKRHGGSARYQPAAAQPKSAGGRPYWQETYSGGPIDVAPLSPGLPGDHYKPVVVPNGAALPFKVVDGVKVFHLIAGEVDHAFDSGLRASCWGYNGRVNSTVIEAVEGERIRVYVTNRLPVATSVHWHGVYLPNGMDGVGGLTQPYVKAGETAKYEWTLRQHGSFMFHSHHDEMTQMGMGLIGMFIVHPRSPSPDHRVDRDFSLMIRIPAASSDWTNSTKARAESGRVPVGQTKPRVFVKGYRPLAMFSRVGAIPSMESTLIGRRSRVTVPRSDRPIENGNIRSASCIAGSL